MVGSPMSNLYTQMITHVAIGVQAALADAEARGAQLHMQLLAAGTREEELTQVTVATVGSGIVVVSLSPQNQNHLFTRKRDPVNAVHGCVCAAQEVRSLQALLDRARFDVKRAERGTVGTAVGAAGMDSLAVKFEVGAGNMLSAQAQRGAPDCIGLLFYLFTLEMRRHSVLEGTSFMIG